MKAWLVKKAGRIDNLLFENIRDPQPGPGQILVRVISTALNPVDFQNIESGHPEWTYPQVPGVDLAGEVVDVGKDVKEFNVGDAVACHTDLRENGGFAELAAVTADGAAKVPENVSYDQAAAILCAGMTAYQAVLQKLNPNQKQSILIHAGSGGVGGFAIQLAKEAGLQVLTTASSHNHEWVKSLGADLAIDYKQENVTKRILEETNSEGVDLVLNSIGADEATEDLNRLSFTGQLAFLSGGPDLSGIKPFTLAPSIHEIALGAAHSSGTQKSLKNLAFMAEELMERVHNKTLDPIINKVLPRTKLVDGLEELKEGHVRGKIIVRMQEEK